MMDLYVVHLYPECKICSSDFGNMYFAYLLNNFVHSHFVQIPF